MTLKRFVKAVLYGTAGVVAIWVWFYAMWLAYEVIVPQHMKLKILLSTGQPYSEGMLIAVVSISLLFGAYITAKAWEAQEI